MKKTNPDFLNGVPELLILRLLEQRPMHGYDLVQAIRTATGEQLAFGEGCIYPVLHRMEGQKLLVGKRMVVNGRTRIVYQLTQQGCQKLAGLQASWKQIVAAVNAVLEGGRNGEPALA
jgi:PadR family transcriptional regulator PadR